MPTMRLIDAYEEKFGSASTWYFGSITWLAPLLSKFLASDRVGRICDRCDAACKVSRSAFKFVMIAEKSTMRGET